MKIHCICIAKNEADVIQLTLFEASRWADRIVFMDNGSTDGTWELVCEMAKSEPKIIPWKQDDVTFQDHLRGLLFRAHAAGAEPGDWWCRLDADEIYARDPREVLASIPRPFHVVWGQSIEYYVTDRDVASIDFSRPVRDVLGNLTYYKADNAEARFFRHRQRLNWPEGAAWPRHMGPVWPRMIPVKHYKYRSPEQAQRRLDTRAAARRGGTEMYWSAHFDQWEPIRAEDLLNESEVGIPRALPVRPDGWFRHYAKVALHALGLLP